MAGEQKRRLNQVRDERDNDEVARNLDRLRGAAKGKDNLMPYMIDCVKCYASVGEITKVLKEVFGEFSEPVGF